MCLSGSFLRPTADLSANSRSSATALIGKKKKTLNDNRESVRFVLINLEKLVGCHEE